MTLTRPIRIFTAVAPAMFAFALLAAFTMVTTSPASAAPIADAPITYCGDPDTDPSMSTGGGTMITCDTVIVNTVTAIDSGTGVASGTATVQVTECVGPANGRLDPNDLTCTTDIQNLTELVTSVDQCNEVGYGGGNVLECSVDVSTIFAGVTPQAVSAATVNQCNGSAPDTTGCNPFPATTTGATVTQCNDSSYGGGQEDFNCLVTGDTTASLSVTVNQCNNSNYGGGSWLNCSAELSVSSVPGPTPVPTPTVAPTTAPSTAPSIPASAAPSAPASSEAPAVIGVSPAPVATAGDTPTSVTTVPAFNIPGISLFPGLPGLPDTRLADATASTSSNPVALLALAGVVTLLSVSLTFAYNRRRR